ncbi:PREDICTED: putative GATA transcription factor 13 [Camelina sativa]|uniref:GATA transcription factor 13 n=1 Tax=Camelina sativa TaxID=90675 RepID=A0ABM0Z5B6_CAMSA|nr:PREDICTED: putative GATA transcription factor 13 [Camelina sativa]
MSNGSWLPEEDLKVLEDNFFDNLVDDIDDFPLENIETADDDEEDRVARPPPFDVLTSLYTELTCKNQASSSNVSSTVDSSPPDVKVLKLIQSISPVSVLENTSGSALSHNQNIIQGLGAEMSQQLVPDESESETHLSSENSAKKKRKKQKSLARKCTHCETTSTPQRKKQKSLARKCTHCETTSTPQRKKQKSPARKCTHCETTKTPQWREGPRGPRTLCNACGVRFRSGRLFPEYRPASSPTFIPTVHSNMHRMIVEMRRKDEGQLDT